MNSIIRRWALLASGVCLSLLGGCADHSDLSSDEGLAAPAEYSSWTGGVAEAAALPSPEETFNTALILGDRALQSAHQAQALPDWQQAAGQWERALNLLRAIPADSSYYGDAQEKIAEYEAQLQPIHEQLDRLRG